MNSTSDHPTEDRLQAFGWGMLATSEEAAVAEHVERCDVCCAYLQRLPDDPLTATLKRAPRDPLDTVEQRSDTHHAAPPSSANLPRVPEALENHARFRVVRLLGTGGMGVVYLAEHRLMDRLVAIKLIDERLLDDEQAVRRFEQEALAAGKLSHENIVATYDVTPIGSSQALVMEYVEGTGLERLVEQQGPLPVAAAVDYARQAATGLAHAHQHGLVHRDIKPHNLMLTPSGRIKILDFGLARLGLDREEVRSSSGLTSAGSILGTPDYMAPEQARDARSIDQRADLYSLGCTLYYLLAGQVPFPAASWAEKLAGHLTRPPESLAKLCPGLPPALVALVERLMAKSPADRPASAASVASELEQIATALARPAAPRAIPVPTAAERLTPLPVIASPNPSTASRPRIRPIGYRTPAVVALVSLIVIALGGLAYWGTLPPSPATAYRVLIIAPPQRDMSAYNDVTNAFAYCKVPHEIEVASTEMIKTDYFTVDHLLSEIDPAEYDAALVLGWDPLYAAQEAADTYYQEQAGRTAGAMLRAGKHVAGHHAGMVTLARAGLLAGRNVADSAAVATEDRASSGVRHWIPGQRVVTDQLLLTSASANDGAVLVHELAEAILP